MTQPPLPCSLPLDTQRERRHGQRQTRPCVTSRNSLRNEPATSTLCVCVVRPGTMCTASLQQPTRCSSSRRRRTLAMVPEEKVDSPIMHNVYALDQDDVLHTCARRDSWHARAYTPTISILDHRHQLRHGHRGGVTVMMVGKRPCMQVGSYFCTGYRHPAESCAKDMEPPTDSNVDGRTDGRSEEGCDGTWGRAVPSSSIHTLRSPHFSHCGR